MAGLQGGGWKADNGRYGGGKAGSEHRYSLAAVDTASCADGANYGSTDTDRRWGGKAGQILRYPNVDGEPRGLMMGGNVGGSGSDAQGFNDAANNYSGVPSPAGSGSTRANTRAAQAYNDSLCNYQGVP